MEVKKLSEKIKLVLIILDLFLVIILMIIDWNIPIKIIIITILGFIGLLLIFSIEKISSNDYLLDVE